MCANTMCKKKKSETANVVSFSRRYTLKNSMSQYSTILGLLKNCPPIRTAQAI